MELFVAATGCVDPEVASFYLECAGHDPTRAVNHFFDSPLSVASDGATFESGGKASSAHHGASSSADAAVGVVKRSSSIGSSDSTARKRQRVPGAAGQQDLLMFRHAKPLPNDACGPPSDTEHLEREASLKQGASSQAPHGTAATSTTATAAAAGAAARSTTSTAVAPSAEWTETTRRCQRCNGTSLARRVNKRRIRYVVTLPRVGIHQVPGRVYYSSSIRSNQQAVHEQTAVGVSRINERAHRKSVATNQYDACNPVHAGNTTSPMALYQWLNYVLSKKLEPEPRRETETCATDAARTKDQDCPYVTGHTKRKTLETTQG